MSKRSSVPGKPISPRIHSIIDYGFALGNLLVPGLLKLRPAAVGVFAGFGVIQGTLNALTAQPFALRKAVPFTLHGAIEKASAPLYVVAPLVAGAALDKRARFYWVGLGAVLVLVYNLTDWDAKKTDR